MSTRALLLWTLEQMLNGNGRGQGWGGGTLQEEGKGL